MFAGGFGGANNQNYWLYTNQNYWTMSPYHGGSYAYVFAVDSYGTLGNWYVNNTLRVRPVINLKADTAMTGSGTTSDPFVVT